MLDVIGLRSEPGSKLLTIRVANRPPVALKGAARRASRQAGAVLAEQVDDQRRLADLARRAAEQGGAARRWWPAASAKARQQRTDRELAAAIDRGRPGVSASIAAAELEENPYREAAGEPPVSDGAVASLMRSFMVRVKGSRLAEGAPARRGGTARLRRRLFLRLFSAVSRAWERGLRARDQTDFEDMLNIATDCIESGRWGSPYRVVMVDEMQDASIARAAMVRALLKRPGTYLCAAGDDWQPVSRFAGAGLSVLARFSEWFGEAETIWLSRTFRSPQLLCDVAGEFVMRNREQLKKRVRSSAPEPGEPLAAIALKDRSQYGNAVLKHCMQLDAQLDSPATLLVLSRYSRGRDDVPSVLEAKFSRLTVDFNTVHASKGKEADYVIVLGLESRGFPSAREDDPLLRDWRWQLQACFPTRRNGACSTLRSRGHGGPCSCSPAPGTNRRSSSNSSKPGRSRCAPPQAPTLRR